MIFQDNELISYYENNFLLMQDHGYSLSDLEGMIPIEREIYMTMLNDYLKEKVEEAKRKSQGLS